MIDAVDKNYFGLGINFTPTWFQVFPSVDVLMPLSWSQGFANSAVTVGRHRTAPARSASAPRWTSARSTAST